MSDTPRTDAASRMAFSGEYMVPIEEAQKLERELAEVTKHRDALAEALELFLSRVRYTSVFMNGNPTGGTFDYRSHGFDAEVELAHKALAATKGGSHE
jgi:hypothetical protein